MGRYADDDYPLQPGLTVTRAAWLPGLLRLSCVKQTGPGDEDRSEFEIAYASLSVSLQASLSRTLRAAIGAYPAWADRARKLPGPGRVTMADLLNPQ